MCLVRRMLLARAFHGLASRIRIAIRSTTRAEVSRIATREGKNGSAIPRQIDTNSCQSRNGAIFRGYLWMMRKYEILFVKRSDYEQKFISADGRFDHRNDRR